MESTLKSCLHSVALIAVDLLLDFMEDARPELSNVSANEYPVSTKVRTRRTLCCLCCRTVNKPPIRDSPFPPHLQSHAAKVVWLSPCRNEKEATSLRPSSKSVTELRNDFQTSEVFSLFQDCPFYLCKAWLFLLPEHPRALHVRNTRDGWRWCLPVAHLWLNGGLPRWDLWWHQVRYKALGCPAQKLSFLKWFFAAGRSREHLHCVGGLAGVSPTKWLCLVQRARLRNEGIGFPVVRLLGLLNPLKLEEQKSYWIIWSIELMCCEDLLVFITCCKFIKGAQPSAIFKREGRAPSVPRHRKGCRRKEETVILFIHQQRSFIISWRGLVVVSRAEVPPVFSSRNITRILSHLSWRLAGENPPNFPGQEEGLRSRALSVVI